MEHGNSQACFLFYYFPVQIIPVFVISNRSFFFFFFEVRGCFFVVLPHCNCTPVSLFTGQANGGKTPKTYDRRVQYFCRLEFSNSRVVELFLC